MKNLTGLPVPPAHGREYQTLPGDNDEESSLQNPFASEGGESGDSASFKSGRSDSILYPQGGSNGDSAANSTRGVSRSYTPSVMHGSDFDRYPNRRSYNQDGSFLGAGSDRGVSYSNSRYSRGSESDRSRSNSYTSFNQEKNPFLTNTDFSPFGGYPASDFPLHMDEKEADDYLHNPDPIADAKFDRRCVRPDRRGFWTMAAFIALIAGAICILIVLPVLAFTGVTARSPPTGQQPTTSKNASDELSPYTYGILKAVRTSLVDPDTPSSALSHTAKDGSSWKLVFSDEFNTDGRTFYDGDDPFWTAMDIWYGATQDLEWYDPDAATTNNGRLQLRMDAFKNHNLNYRSGMLQSWNKLCFTQGYIEISARLPGSGDASGFWPGLWTLGNLGRPGYLATTDGTWPYAYNECDAGITPNQSAIDGISYLPGQRLNKCVCPGEDHPSPGIGRGAPEIDIIEATVATPTGLPANGAVSQSLQVAPMDIWYMVDYNFVEVFNTKTTQMNSWSGGPFQQAISGVTFLNNNWYEIAPNGGEGSFQTYAFEYLNDDNTGYIEWYVGEDPVYAMARPALGPNGNVGDREISKEPMSIIMNVGISNSWVYINWLALVFPATFEIDYVRIYQPSDEVNITCDPPGYPTFDYIEAHPKAYQNPNMTHWSTAGYTWPKNKLMNSC